MAIEIDKTVGYHEGQIVKFFMPETGNSQQIDQGVVVKVDHWNQQLHVQAAKMGLQHVRMHNPNIEVLNPDEL